MKLRNLSLVLFGCLAVAAVFLSFPEREENVIARVDGVPVTEETFRFWWDRDRPSEDSLESRQEVLDRVIARTALAKQARDAGLDEDPEILEAIDSLLIAKLKERELQPKLAALNVSVEEAREQYEANEERYVMGARKRVAVLWFNTRGLEPLVARYKPRLDSIRSELDADPLLIDVAEGFGGHALKNSEHRASRHRGGDLGWVDDQSGGDPFKNAVVEIARGLTEPGDLSPVVVSPAGLFLVRLTGVETASVKPFEEVKPLIVRALTKLKREDIEKAFQARFATAGSVTVDTERLATVDNLRTRARAQDTVPSPKLSLNRK